MLTRLRNAVAAYSMAGAISGCGSDSAVVPPPTIAPAPAPAALFAEFSLPGMDVNLTRIIFFKEMRPAGANWANCSYSTASQSFACPAENSAALTLTRSYTLLDGAGMPQSSYDATKTAALRVNFKVAGTVREDNQTLTLAGSTDLTLSGLLAGPHVLNGATSIRGTGTLVGGGQSTPLDVTASATITNLIMPSAPPTGIVWPLSGVISAGNVVVLGLTSSPSRVTMTFSGASTVDLVTLEGGVTKSCTVNIRNFNYPECP